MCFLLVTAEYVEHSCLLPLSGSKYVLHFEFSNPPKRPILHKKGFFSLCKEHWPNPAVQLANTHMLSFFPVYFGGFFFSPVASFFTV